MLFSLLVACAFGASSCGACAKAVLPGVSSTKQSSVKQVGSLFRVSVPSNECWDVIGARLCSYTSGVTGVELWNEKVLLAETGRVTTNTTSYESFYFPKGYRLDSSNTNATYRISFNTVAVGYCSTNQAAFPYPSVPAAYEVISGWMDGSTSKTLVMGIIPILCPC